MSTPLEIYRAWRAATDAHAAWRRSARELDRLVKACPWSHASLRTGGGLWSLTIGPKPNPVLTVHMLEADDCTP